MIFAWLFGRRRRLLKSPFPADWETFLQTNCRHFAYLPADKQERLRNTVKIIVGERTWVGVGELVVTDEMKVTIAAQAALLLLGVDDYYFDRVSSFVIHPRRFESRSTNADLHTRFQQVTPVVGEAHQIGPVVLLWQEALAGARGHAHGSNLVLHELAHHLDSLDGEMGGMPPLPSREAVLRWEQVLEEHYQQLITEVQQGYFTLLDEYGTTNKAEFFAVATECFYEQPRALREEHPELFQLLSDFYRIDPTAWWPDVE
jgi:Mlc titration factor MtfA (ptsG expression regulator)